MEDFLCNFSVVALFVIIIGIYLQIHTNEIKEIKQKIEILQNQYDEKGE